MLEKNVEFIEQYKRLDKLCKETLNSYEGVSSYISEMEATPFEATVNISEWDMTYKQIKHFRWMRNQLVHEISLDENLSTNEDIMNIKNLHELIVKAQDPLSIANRSRQDDYYYSKNNSSSENQDSFWNKIKTKIKSLFS
ncbi:MAG: hypothetical protein K2L52_00600 [Clostridia bacterium]|nr:hypothetical protein [Clostridia bacterium]